MKNRQLFNTADDQLQDTLITYFEPKKVPPALDDANSYRLRLPVACGCLMFPIVLCVLFIIVSYFTNYCPERNYLTPVAPVYPNATLLRGEMTDDYDVWAALFMEYEIQANLQEVSQFYSNHLTFPCSSTSIDLRISCSGGKAFPFGVYSILARETAENVTIVQIDLAWDRCVWWSDVPSVE